MTDDTMTDDEIAIRAAIKVSHGTIERLSVT